MNYDYDIIIVGSGLVGASLALALQNLPNNLKIAVLENNPPIFTPQQIENSRPLCLSLGSYLILKKLFLNNSECWAEILAKSCPIQQVHVSEKKHFGVMRFTALEEQVPALGYVVPMNFLHQQLYQVLIKLKQVQLISIKNLQKIEASKDQVKIELQTEKGLQILNAQLLIACDGTESSCRQLLNIATEVTNAEESALTATLTLRRKHNFTAYQRFTPEGIVAILPSLDRHSVNMVWSMSNEIFTKINREDPDQQKVRLQKLLGDRLGPISSFKKTGEYPLRMVIAEEQVRPSIVLLGNAAHTLYPIAAQGFNLGLRDVELLSEMLINQHQKGGALGDMQHLKDYQDKRKADQEAVINLTRKVMQFFSLNLSILGKMRALGMLTTDIFQLIKHRLAKRTMGLVRNG